MPESDLIWLSLLLFLPAGRAAGLLAFPSAWKEAMRWWAVFGAAGTLSISLCVVVGYYNLLDSHLDANGMPRQSVHTRLDARARTRLPATRPAQCRATNPGTGWHAARGSRPSTLNTHSA